MDPAVMFDVYLACAVTGGTLLVCQFLLSLLGLGGHDDVGGDAHDVGGDLHEMGGHDVGGHEMGGHDGDGHGHDGHGHGHDSGSNRLVSLLTFRTLVAALTFFGLAGLAAAAPRQLDPPWVLAVALAAGAGALFLVAWVMRLLKGLHAEGTARIERSVGKRGTVYLTVPGNKAGLGKVQLNLQNRTVEYQAVTGQQTLPTGTKIIVTAVVTRDTVEVAPAPDTGSPSHA
jgi:hypothetical protein